MFDVRSLFAALRGRGTPDSLGPGEAALAAAEAAAPDDVARARLANKRGVAHVGDGDRERALDAFAHALVLDERCAPALTNIGNLLYEDGHAHDAIDYYRAAIRADDGYALAHQNLGVALKSLGRHGEAVRSLRTATRLAAKRRASRS